MDGCCMLFMVVAGLETVGLLGICAVLYRNYRMYSRQSWR